MEEFKDFLNASGLINLDWKNLVLLLVGTAFAIVAIAKKTEPYVLLPIGVGIILANLPLTGLTDYSAEAGQHESGILGLIFEFALFKWNILPPLIFLGLGALTDFGPIIANPKTLLLGAAAQMGVFAALWIALVAGFSMKEAGAIAIIGGADGPTTIFASARLAPDLLGITAITAYSYMASVVFIQPPLMRLLTTKEGAADCHETSPRSIPLGEAPFPHRHHGNHYPGGAGVSAADSHVYDRQLVQGKRRSAEVV